MESSQVTASFDDGTRRAQRQDDVSIIQTAENDQSLTSSYSDVLTTLMWYRFVVGPIPNT